MKSQRGVISMISALMVSVLVIIVAMGLIVYINSSAQQGSDDELSLRAYAAAQGGVEWAYNQILQNPNTTFPNCTAANTANPNLFNFGASSAPNDFQNAIT